jgi:hypothetical protein
MPYNLLLLPLLGGFLFISLSNRFKFSLIRGDSYRLLLQSSVAGVFLLLASILLTSWLGDSLRAIDTFWHQHVLDAPQSGVAFLSFFLGLILGPASNIVYSKDAAGDRAAKEKGDPLELLLRNAVNNLRPVLITAKNGKVYCGLVTFTSSPTEPIESITVLPRISGYRRPEDKRVTFTTDYRPVLNAILNSDSKAKGLNPNDLAVVIPIREIESACLFEKQVYDNFFSEAAIEEARRYIPVDKLNP